MRGAHCPVGINEAPRRVDDPQPGTGSPSEMRPLCWPTTRRRGGRPGSTRRAPQPASTESLAVTASATASTTPASSSRRRRPSRAAGSPGELREVALAKLRVHVDLADAERDRTADVDVRDPGGAVERERDADAVVDRTQSVPVELRGARTSRGRSRWRPPGSHIPSRRRSGPLRRGSSGRRPRPPPRRRLLDVAELGLDAGLRGTRERRRRRRRCRSSGASIRPHHRARPRGERCVDQLDVVDVVELDVCGDARLVGDRQERR